MVTKTKSNIINNIKVFVTNINIKTSKIAKKGKESEWKERKEQSRNSPSKKESSL